MNQYLQETAMLDFSNPNIQKLIEIKHWKEQNEFDCLKAIYNFVRDDIAFGYNTDDGISASKVLKDGYGQCNTKGTLFMALLRACEIPCRVHGFTIDKQLQKGVMSEFVYKMHRRIYFTVGLKCILKISGMNLKPLYWIKSIYQNCKNNLQTAPVFSAVMVLR